MSLKNAGVFWKTFKRNLEDKDSKQVNLCNQQEIRRRFSILFIRTMLWTKGNQNLMCLKNAWLFWKTFKRIHEEKRSKQAHFCNQHGICRTFCKHYQANKQIINPWRASFKRYPEVYNLFKKESQVFIPNKKIGALTQFLQLMCQREWPLISNHHGQFA